MNTKHIVYTEKKALRDEIFTHLQACNECFLPHLCKTVDIGEYAKKIHSNAVTFEAWSNQRLIGLVGAYLNDTDGRHGYITNVSIVKEFMGRGIATRLIAMCLEKTNKEKFIDIMLEVFSGNVHVIRLYQKFGFCPYRISNNQVFMKLNLERSMFAKNS